MLWALNMTKSPDFFWHWLPMFVFQMAFPTCNWFVQSVQSSILFIWPDGRYPIHTSETLAQINDALHAFYLNCNILVSLGIHTYFHIHKLYNAGHYYELIQLYGTANNFNTEFTEHLHIDLAKDAYTLTNFKDKFPQMTHWLD
jgi:hypothetical protein